MSKYLYGISAFVLGFVILSVSVLRSIIVPPVYGYTTVLPSTTPAPTPIPEIIYSMPYPGKILPDSWLWYVKVTRDKAKYYFSRNALKRADLALLYSDKRLGAAIILAEKKKPDLAVSVLTKGEKYLEMAQKSEVQARSAGINTNDFLTKIATASLRHRQIIEEKILPLIPEDLKPEVVKAEDYSKNTYKNSRDALNGKGMIAPKDPFNGQ